MYQEGTQSSYECNRLNTVFMTRNRQHPEKIAETLRALHQSPLGHGRYVLANSLRPLLVVDPQDSAARTFHIVCTTGLPKVLVNILYDPRVYVWRDPSSPLYHPGLEVGSFYLNVLLVLIPSVKAICRLHLQKPSWMLPSYGEFPRTSFRAVL